MSDPIVVSGQNLWDIRMKLGIRTPEFSISLSGDPFQPSFHVQAKDASQRFTSPQQAVRFLRSELLTFLRKVKYEKTALKKALRKKNRRSKKAR